MTLHVFDFWCIDLKLISFFLIADNDLKNSEGSDVC